MKKFLFLIFILGACSQESRTAFVNSYNLHPRKYYNHQELAWRLSVNPDFFLILDMRPNQEYQETHITGAVNYDVSKQKGGFTALNDFLLQRNIPTKPLMVYNKKGNYGSLFYSRLKNSDFDVFFLEGGFFQWKKNRILNVEANKKP